MQRYEPMPSDIIHTCLSVGFPGFCPSGFPCLFCRFVLLVPLGRPAGGPGCSRCLGVLFVCLVFVRVLCVVCRRCPAVGRTWSVWSRVVIGSVASPIGARDSFRAAVLPMGPPGRAHTASAGSGSR